MLETPRRLLCWLDKESLVVVKPYCLSASIHDGITSRIEPEDQIMVVVLELLLDAYKGPRHKNVLNTKLLWVRSPDATIVFFLNINVTIKLR